MCSFIFLISLDEINKESFLNANQLIKSRGPDKTNTFFTKYEKFHIASVHNLLDISGFGIKQPLIDESGKILLFNGEIYHPSEKDIPDSLLLFKEFQRNNLSSFLKKGLGEFVISSIDLNNKIINLFVDLIGTKPLFYAHKDNQLCIATYSSVLENLGFDSIQNINSNKEITIDFSNLKKPNFFYKEIYNLNLEQNINNFDQWNESFLASIKKRATFFDTKFFVPLSSGYDSGAICAALNYLKIPYTTITIGDSENSRILKKRILINRQESCVEHINLKSCSWKEYRKTSNLLKKELGIISYFHKDDEKKYTKPKKLHEDSGSVGMFLICKEMKSRGYNAVLSGTGADEIFSDYGHGGIKYYPHSEFGGLFPDKLEGFFPWRKFYGDSQKSYLTKDEMVAGLFGIEGRYPFLDKDLIQQFLQLSVELKNSRYKNCIANFLEINHYPYESGTKLGFVPQKTKFTIIERAQYRLRNLFGMEHPNG